MHLKGFQNHGGNVLSKQLNKERFVALKTAVVKAFTIDSPPLSALHGAISGLENASFLEHCLP